MNTHQHYVEDKRSHTQPLAKGGNPYVIASLKDLFETFHFGAFAYLGLQLAAVVVVSRQAEEWFGVDLFVAGGLYLAYTLVVDSLGFLAKFGMHYSVFLRSAWLVALLTMVPVILVETAHRLMHLVQL